MDQEIPLPEDPSSYYPPICAWNFQVVSFSQVSPPKPCIRLYSPAYMLHVPPTSFSRSCVFNVATQYMYTGLFKMIVGVLTTCHPQYT